MEDKDCSREIYPFNLKSGTRKFYHIIPDRQDNFWSTSQLIR